MTSLLRFAALFAWGLLLCAQCAVGGEFSFDLGRNKSPRDKSLRGVTLLLDGQLFTEYLINHGPKPILWPVIGPGGKEMTRQYPMKYASQERRDHAHHRSIWFTHGNVNGIDFWSEAPNKHGRIVHREYLQLVAEGKKAVIATINDWVAPDGKKVCQDERTITFGNDSHSRWIDFDITLQASEGPVTFGDTKEGTMGVRVATSMDVTSELGGRIVNSQGQTDLDAWGKPASWVDYYGPIDGEVYGIAVMNHPSSFRYPTTWHVRTYGLFTANPFGLHDFTRSAQVDGSHTIAAGESITLRYRILLHRGDEKAGRVAELFNAYSSEKE